MIKQQPEIFSCWQANQAKFAEFHLWKGFSRRHSTNYNYLNLCSVVVDSQLLNRHLEMLVHASPKHFGMVAEAAEKQAIISIIRSSCCRLSSACFSWYLRNVSSLLWSASSQVWIRLSCAFWRFSEVVENWLMASFCEVILHFLGRTETHDFCTSSLSFLEAFFKTTSSSSMEVPCGRRL